MSLPFSASSCIRPLPTPAARHSPSPWALSFPQVAIAAFASRSDWPSPQTASCSPPTTHPSAFVAPQPGAELSYR